LSETARALWVWDTSAVTSALRRIELFAFCRDRKISTLFFHMGEFYDQQYSARYQQELRNFISRAHDEGLRVNALQVAPPSPNMAAPENQYPAITYLRPFLEYNRQRDPAHRFDGYLENIKPQLLPGWAGNEHGIQESFAAFVHEYRKTFIEFDPELPLGWAMPPDFDRYDWLPRVYTNLDYVVVMSSHDESVPILQDVKDEIELGNRVGTKVVISVETGDPAAIDGVRAGATFHEEGALRLEAVLDEVAAALAGNPSFGGIAISRYRTFAKLPAPPRSP
jgi:hypothetical protein